jgi:phosphoglycerate dehydrogenase-like enzyme
MNILIHSRSRKDDLCKKMGFEYADSLEDLLKRSDIVSLHVPSTTETKNMVNK